MAEHFLPAGAAADKGFDVYLPPERAGWDQSGLRVLTLAPGQGAELGTGDEEWLVIPLAGAFDVAADGREYALRGRRDVFEGPTDTLYLPPGTGFEISSRAGGRVAFTSARARGEHPVQFLAAQDAPIARRGAGTMSRKAHEYLMRTGALRSEKLMALEVYTPAGNWSSYPPHKHDVDSDTETQLEEVYYFELEGEADRPAAAYQRVFSSDERPIDVLAEIHSGDVVLVPYGWHGPAVAPPGNDLYYLNVMAGNGDTNEWTFTDLPSAAWVRSSWEGMEFDPRIA